MKKTKISTDLAPSAIGIYSQAIRAGSFVFISGQIPLDPKSMTIIDGDIIDHIKQVLSNIKAISDIISLKFLSFSVFLVEILP